MFSFSFKLKVNILTLFTVPSGSFLRRLEFHLFTECKNFRALPNFIISFVSFSSYKSSLLITNVMFEFKEGSLKIALTLNSIVHRFTYVNN